MCGIQKLLLRCVAMAFVGIGCFQVSYAQTVTLIDPGTDNRIAEIQGLSINGLTYDATFHYGTNFNGLTDPLTFAGNSIFDFSQSEAAAEAVASAVGTLPALPGSTGGVLVPNFVFGNLLTLAYIPRQTDYTQWDPSDVRFAIANRNVALPSDFAWATFQEAVAAVPEPSGLALALMLATGTIFLRGRRRVMASHSGSKG
ncbi:MAG: hypothetical protein AAFV88_08415 [Planctomycetota bacterium]